MCIEQINVIDYWIEGAVTFLSLWIYTPRVTSEKITFLRIFYYIFTLPFLRILHSFMFTQYALCFVSHVLFRTSIHAFGRRFDESIFHLLWNQYLPREYNKLRCHLAISFIRACPIFLMHLQNSSIIKTLHEVRHVKTINSARGYCKFQK